MTKSERSALVLMSGGVDSAVAAALLIEQGYHVEALFLRLFHDGVSDASSAAAKALSGRLGIRFHEADFSQRFHREIIDYFITSYSKGRTPNPCVKCNPIVKIGAGLEVMKGLGLKYLATGHYARIEGKKHNLRLLRGVDFRKDQSYFLHGIDRNDLSRILFPLGAMKKSQVAEAAEKRGIRGLVQPESQDVCFLRGDYREFLKGHGLEFAGLGKMLDISGREVGTHRGLENYTVGQRRGLGLPGPEPTYVIRLDIAENTLVVGPESALYTKEVRVKDPNWLIMPEELSSDVGFRCAVKIRYRHEAAPAQVIVNGDQLSIIFEEPQRAVTPGQFAVIYLNDAVAGGGEICA